VDRAAAAKAIDAFLVALGRDPAREPAIAGTGARVTEAFADELLAGYAVDTRALVAQNTIDAAGAVRAGETDVEGLVVVRDVAVATMCPHHLMPARGVAAVAFAPRGKLVGVGTVVDLVDAFARRLTLQEDLGQNVADALLAGLAPAWAACRLVLEHACMTVRGPRRHGARVETIAIAGALGAWSRGDVLHALGSGA
jgi:GTP cyclohydrolase I